MTLASSRLRLALKFRRRSVLKAVASRDKVLWVDPKSVRRSLPILHGKWPMGQIRSGPWDQDTVDISRKAVFVFYRQVLLQGVDPQETDLYRWHLERIGHRVHPKYRSLADLDRSIEMRLDLVESIKRHGVVEPIEYGRYKIDSKSADSIRINIDRFGSFIFGPGGSNRLAIAQALYIRKVPAKVCARHEEWQLVRERVWRRVRSEREYRRRTQDIVHPDFALNDHPDLDDLLRVRVAKDGE